MNAPGRTESILYALFVLGLLLPWLWIQINLSINVDIAFLTQSALRLLSGEKMSEAYYDANPPLSVLAYVIPAALTKYIGIPVIYGTLGYSLALIGISAILVHKALLPFTSLSSYQKRVILAAYVLTNTVAANFYLGEKDQYVLLGLFPLTLSQLALTYRLGTVGAPRTGSFIMGAIFLMLKPHFYILPTLMIAHRIALQKRLMAVFDPDALWLAAAAMAYAAVLLLFFNDFLAIILPDILNLYSSIREQWVGAVFLKASLAVAMLAVPALLLTKTPNRFTLFFLFASWLCLIPYVIQGKGFYYHMLPAVTFFCCGFALLLHDLLNAPLPALFKEKTSAKLGLFGSTLILAGALYAIFFPSGKNPALTHAEYDRMPLTIVVREACENKPDCSFFLFNEMTEIIHQTAVYAPAQHGSRFPSFWFLAQLTNPANKSLSQEDKNRLAAKYAAMVASDLAKFKPEILILGRFDLEGKGKIFDFNSYFSKHSGYFVNEIARYRFDRTLSLNQRIYFPGTLVPDQAVTYDIFRRIE